jgi:hypothetical protein
MEEYMLPCLFKKMFGIDCVGCGMQRSFNFILHGEFEKAFYMFPAIYTSILFAMSLGLYIFDKKRSHHKLVIILALINVTIMLVSYTYKMRFIF